MKNEDYYKYLKIAIIAAVFAGVYNVWVNNIFGIQQIPSKLDLFKSQLVSGNINSTINISNNNDNNINLEQELSKITKSSYPFDKNDNMVKQKIVLKDWIYLKENGTFNLDIDYYATTDADLILGLHRVDDKKTEKQELLKIHSDLVNGKLQDAGNEYGSQQFLNGNLNNWVNEKRIWNNLPSGYYYLILYFNEKQNNNWHFKGKIFTEG